MPSLSPIARKILNTLRIHGMLTRAQLSRLTEASLTKVTDATRQLVHMGLVNECEGASSGGRRPTLLRIKSDLCHTLGIDVGTQNLRAVVVDTAGRVAAHAHRREPLRFNRTISMDDVLSVAGDALERASISKELIKGIGIGITGIVDELNGTCLFMPNAQQWRGFPVVRLLREAWMIPNVYITDSVRGMALAEMRYGLGRGIDNFVLVNIGVGLGAGIVVNGKVVTGSRGIAGEIGHIYVGESNGICCCGNHGCLESIASGWALSRQVAKAVGKGVVTSIKSGSTPDGADLISDVIDAAKSGDKFALNMLDEAADYISIGISALINLLSPQRIIIGGGLAEGAGSLLLDPLIRKTKARSLPWVQSDIDIRLSELGQYSAARGAATMAMDRVFAEDWDSLFRPN